MIFILGGKGFVGSAFARFCKSQNKEFIVINRQNYDSYKGKSCDIFVNANGNSSKILATKNPIEDFDATVASTKKSLIDFNFKKYVLLSSCDVYPDCSSPLLTSEDCEIDLSKQSTYGFHKYLAEQCVRHDVKRWLVIRLGGMIGIGLRKNPVFDIMYGGPLWVDPKSELQYMNTDDVARIVFEILDKEITNDIFNVCGDGLVKLESIMDYNKIKVNSDSPIVKYNVNIDKIKKNTKVPDSMESVINFIKTIGVKAS